MNMQQELSAEWLATAVECHKQTRAWRRYSSVFTVECSLICLVEVYHTWYWYALTQLLVCWGFYRLYLKARRREQLWFLCVFHSRKMSDDTPEHTRWHIHQIVSALELLGPVRKKADTD